MIPRRRHGQSFEEHQSDMAAWLGTDVANMDRQHDPLHRAIAGWLGITSHAMRDAAGERLTAREQALAVLEEAACLHLQRYLVNAGAEVPNV